MASAITCDLCGEEVAVLMQSNLTNGDSSAVGQACLITFSLSCALAFAEGIPPEIAVEYRELVAAVVTTIAPDLLMPVKPEKAPRKARAVAEAPADPTRQDAPAAGTGADAPATGDPEMDGAGAREESASL